MSSVVVTADPAIVVTQDNPAVTAVVPVTSQPYAYSSLSGLPALGTAAALNVGTGSNQVVVLDGSSRLPPVDGSQITNLPLFARSVHSGKLSYVSATQLILAPLKGVYLQINGVLCAIPSAGVTLSNAGLAASTLYYVYAYMNAGVMTLEASTTAHLTSATAANVGTEIKSGDDTRSLMGMCYTNASSQFVDSTAARQVRSWFNDSGMISFGSSGTTIATSSTSTVELEVAARCTGLMWTGEAFELQVAATAANSTAGQICFTDIWLNGSAGSAVTMYGHTPVAAYAGNQINTTSSVSGADQLITLGIAGHVSANTGSWYEKMTRILTVRK